MSPEGSVVKMKRHAHAIDTKTLFKLSQMYVVYTTRTLHTSFRTAPTIAGVHTTLPPHKNYRNSVTYTNRTWHHSTRLACILCFANMLRGNGRPNPAQHEIKRRFVEAVPGFKWVAVLVPNLLYFPKVLLPIKIVGVIITGLCFGSLRALAAAAEDRCHGRSSPPLLRDSGRRNTSPLLTKHTPYQHHDRDNSKHCRTVGHRARCIGVGDVRRPAAVAAEDPRVRGGINGGGSRNRDYRKQSVRRGAQMTAVA
jgi:hypothetical protein